MTGTFNMTGRGQIYYDDKELDDIYDRISDLEYDIKSKLEELQALLEKENKVYEEVHEKELVAEEAYDIAEQATREDPDDEEAEAAYKKASDALDDAYDASREQYNKVNTLEDHIDYLESWLRKFD